MVRLAILLLLLGLAVPGDAVAGRSVSAFERFVQNSGWVCRKSPAPDCVAAGFKFADRDGDQHLSPTEVEELRRDYANWIAWKRPQLSARHRVYASVADRIATGLDTSKLFAGYDADGDGLLTRPELLTDVRLDQRLLRQVLLDPNSVNWDGLAERVGGIATLARALGTKALRQPKDVR